MYHTMPACQLVFDNIQVTLEAEEELIAAQKIEEENDYSDAMESMDRKYWEGQLDAYSYLYSLTYLLAFEEGIQEDV